MHCLSFMGVCNTTASDLFPFLLLSPYMYKYCSSFINVLFFIRVEGIVDITPNVTEVVLLLLKWTRFTRDLKLYKGNLRCISVVCRHSPNHEFSYRYKLSILSFILIANTTNNKNVAFHESSNHYFFIN